MSLVIDDRGTTAERCAVCDADYTCVTGYVRDDDGPAAVYYAALHGHDYAHEAYLDVTLAETTDSSRVTVGARLGDFGSHGGLGAALTDGEIAHESPSVQGRRLTADEALAHRRLDQFWSIVDLVLETDPDVHAHTHTRA